MKLCNTILVRLRWYCYVKEQLVFKIVNLKLTWINEVGDSFEKKKICHNQIN